MSRDILYHLRCAITGHVWNLYFPEMSKIVNLSSVNSILSRMAEMKKME
jgi:hypothetical protein